MYNFIQKEGKIRALRDINIRIGIPSVNAKALSVSKGTIFSIIGYVNDGDSVNGNSLWYKNNDGNYIWSGNIEEIENNNELKFIWPLEKSYKRITTPFSETWIKNSKKNHTGIDIAAPIGEKVFTVADGVVKKIGYLDVKKEMAQYIGVEHRLGNYCSAYLHITPTVKTGDEIKAGDVIGNIAQLIKMGAHLHFNVWKGTYNNPITHRGALPKIEYTSEFTDPVFPSNFIDPMSINYS